MVCRCLRVLAVACCGFGLATLELLAQSAVSQFAVVDHCPMPVHGLSSGDTIPTFMPESTVEFFIRVVPATCANPLAPDSVSGRYAMNRRITRHGPFRITMEQAQALHRWIIEQSDSAKSTPVAAAGSALATSKAVGPTQERDP